MRKSDVLQGELLERNNKPLLTVDEYLRDRGMSLDVLKDNIKAGSIKLRKHKNQVYVIDVPQFGYGDSEIDGSEVKGGWYRRLFKKPARRHTVYNLLKDGSPAKKMEEKIKSMERMMLDFSEAVNLSIDSLSKKIEVSAQETIRGKAGGGSILDSIYSLETVDVEKPGNAAVSRQSSKETRVCGSRVHAAAAVEEAETGEITEGSAGLDQAPASAPKPAAIRDERADFNCFIKSSLQLRSMRVVLAVLVLAVIGSLFFAGMELSNKSQWLTQSQQYTAALNEQFISNAKETARINSEMKRMKAEIETLRQELADTKDMVKTLSAGR